MSRLPSGNAGKIVEVAGVALTDLPPPQAAHLVAAMAAAGMSVDVHLVNAYTISLVDTDAAVSRAVSSAALNFADGKPLTWVARLLYRRSLHQVPGPDLFENVIAIGHEYGLRHYFLGSTDEKLKVLLQQLRKRHPYADFAGTHSPPFRPLRSDEVANQDQRISQSGANIVWVALGTPKQDLEAARLARKLDVTVVAVGAAFDFSAGTLRRSPPWIARMGLEWLFRWFMEPRRLWHRYTVGNARFVVAVTKDRLSRLP
jgi:N-acetylglucosaminyldiphosphoundecaprenol N-acetyl-beta-D-mannosaminyltransferase